MSWENLQHDLLMCISSEEPMIQNAAQTANSYTEMLKAGQISKEEYTELLLDIQRSLDIQSHMAEMDAKIKLNVAINGLINLASLV